MMTNDQVFQAAMALPPSERAELAQALYQTLESDYPELDEAVLIEAERRYLELENGTVQGLPYEEVMNEIRKSLK